MFYEFPERITRAEILAAIQAVNDACGATSFIEADRGDHYIYNYLVAFPQSFPQPTTDDPALNRQYAILRELRGLIWCKVTNTLLARRYHKFFNVNEKEFTQQHLIDWSQPHVILEKLDGSMITPFFPQSGPAWGTKMGQTDVALPVETFVRDYDLALGNPNKGYAALAEMCRRSKITPIFEWCTRKQKIVIDYPVDELILTGIRANETGEYMPHRTMESFGELFGVPVIKQLFSGVGNVEQFMAAAKDVVGMEGYIIRFDNGHMLKVKGAWYCQIHKTKDLLQFEKDVWKLILDEHMDDAMAFMDEPDRERVGRFITDFETGIATVGADLARRVEEGRAQTGGEKKRFAMEYIKTQPKADHGLLFSIYDGHEPSSVIKDMLKKHVSSQTKVNAMRAYVNGVDWDNYRDRTVILDD